MCSKMYAYDNICWVRVYFHVTIITEIYARLLSIWIYFFRVYIHATIIDK